MATTTTVVYLGRGKRVEAEVELGPAARTAPGHSRRHVIVDGVDAGYVESFTSSIQTNYANTRMRRPTKERKFWRAMDRGSHRVSGRLEETRAYAVEKLVRHHVELREKASDAPTQ